MNSYIYHPFMTEIISRAVNLITCIKMGIAIIHYDLYVVNTRYILLDLHILYLNSVSLH